MRLVVLAALMLPSACHREPSFDDRFANASATIANQSAAMDNQMRALEAQERADTVPPGPAANTAAKPATPTVR